MGLELNDTIEPYKDFRSDNATRYTQQMPLVIADGRVPIGVAQVAERRLNSQQPAWKDNYFNTGDEIAYEARNGNKFKVVVGSDFLRTINPKSRFTSGGALILPSYEDVQGAEFSRKDKGLILGRDLTADEARNHPIWRELAGDQELLNEYVGRMFAEYQERFAKSTPIENITAMGIYLAGLQQEATARALCVGWLVSGSQLRGGSRLGYDDARLVGVAPEALRAPNQAIVRPTLEQALLILNQDLSGLEIRKK